VALNRSDLMSAPIASPPEPAQLHRLRWLSAESRVIRCLTCARVAEADGVVSVPMQRRRLLPDRKAVLYRCRFCRAGTFLLPRQADYGAQVAEAALAFYLQQGAGVWSIASNLLALRRPPGTRLLEIGCGFGFGLDFARRALGWSVQGFDPSPFAAEGRAQLGLPIENRLFGAEADMRGGFDVVLASEFIEHVSDPAAMLAALRRALARGGVLALTTPDMDAALPSTPMGALIPLLSPGYHTALQTRESLERLLQRAGFGQVEVERRGTTLVARAHVDGATRHDAGTADHAIFRRYLADAMAAAQPDGDLWLGLASRAYREALGQADFASATRLWTLLDAASERRYGRPLDQPAQPERSLQLAELARHEPLCLGALLLHRGLHLLGEGGRRADAADLFSPAEAASARLRAALQASGNDDADAEMIGWCARAETVLCAAENGDPDTPSRLARLEPSPGGAARLRQISQRAFVALVNAGAYDAAASLVPAVLAPAPPSGSDDTMTDDTALDVLFCAGNLELLRHGGDPAAALSRLHLGRQRAEQGLLGGRLTGSPARLIWPLLQAECLALRVLGRGEEQAALVEGVVSRVGHLQPPPDVLHEPGRAAP
jgi:SAM-dependent methyltransferase